MRQIKDHVVVKVSSTTLDIASQVKDPEGNTVNIYRDTTHQPYTWARINGTVVSTPMKLSKIPLYSVYPGSPQPRTGKDHDAIERSLKTIHPRFKSKVLDRYGPYHYREKTVTLNEGPLDIENGDEAWFMYHCIADEAESYTNEFGEEKLYRKHNENYLQYDSTDNTFLYRIPFEHIFGVRRDNEFILLNGFVLVKPLFHENKNHGNIINPGIKKEKKYLEGVLKKIGQPVGYDTRPDVKEGDTIIFTHHSEFLNEIEGEEVYVMRQWDIIAKRMGKNIKPVGDYVLIEPVEVENHSQIYLNFNINSFVGIVKDKGVNARLGNGWINRRVLFNPKNIFYVYLEEINRVLIRDVDIMAFLDSEITQYVKDKHADKILLTEKK